MTVATVLLPPPRLVRCSMLTVGGMPVMRSTSGRDKLLDELPGIDVHRIQEPPLPLGKEQVKRQRALARAADAGDHHELAPRHRQREILQVVLPRAVDGDGAVAPADSVLDHQTPLLLTTEAGRAKQRPARGE